MAPDANTQFRISDEPEFNAGRGSRAAAPMCPVTANAASVQKCTAIMEKCRSAARRRTGGGREKPICRAVPARACMDQAMNIRAAEASVSRPPKAMKILPISEV